MSPMKAGVLTAVMIAAVAWWGVTQVQTPPVKPATGPATAFSAERALEHLRHIAKEPRPPGTPAHAAAQDYIMKQFAALGVQPEVQSTTVVSPRWGSPYGGAYVHNILARLPGTANTKALMLSGHYDSVSAGPGASDDAHAVAVELETLRALRVGPRLRNDVIFMAVDSEEGGLLGAKAFVDQHPWAKQVGLVLNFEARGTSGPGMLFETSEGNGRLMREFAAAAPHPVTSSLSYEAYKLLPNDTDLTIYKQAGLPGLGFAFVNDVINYHTQHDDVAHINPGTLQQQGDYALSLARQFGNQDLTDVRSPNATYFVVPILGVVVYPIQWSVALALAAAVLFTAVMALGISRRRLTLGGTLKAFGLFLLAVVASCAAVWAMWSLARGQGSGYWQNFAGDPYHAGVYRAASIALAIAITSALYTLFLKKAGVLNLWAGALLFWLLMALGTSFPMPGATYVFLWPMAACTVALGILLLRNQEPGATFGGVVMLWVFSLPGLIILAPSIVLLFMSLTMRMAAASVFATVLLIGLLIPCLQLIAGAGRWSLPAGAALACVGFLVAGASMSGFDRDAPRTDSIYYGLDADTHKAIWFSLDQEKDAWTARYLGANPQRASLPQFVPFLAWQYLTHDAPAVDLTPPLIEKLDESSDGQSRTLHLRVRSPRLAQRMWVYGDERYQVLSADVNGTPVEANKAYDGLRAIQKAFAYKLNRWGLSYLDVPPEGLDLHMRLKGPAQAYRMETVDQSYGIAGLPGVAPRPESMIPFPIMMDSVMVRKAYTF